MKLYNDDSLSIMKTMKDNSIDLIVTDPPYEISTTGGGGTINSIKKFDTSLWKYKQYSVSVKYLLEYVGKAFVLCQVIISNLHLFLFT